MRRKVRTTLMAMERPMQTTSKMGINHSLYCSSLLSTSVHILSMARLISVGSSLKNSDFSITSSLG